jgi:hypothetical protein
MKNRLLFLPFCLAIIMSNTACNSTPIKNDMAEFSKPQETLYVYEDGKMKLDSRYIDSKDVVIYSDGRGGEKAAVKVHFPLHSNFYRDSIIVVRVVNKYEESISQQEPENVDQIN